MQSIRDFTSKPAAGADTAASPPQRRGRAAKPVAAAEPKPASQPAAPRQKRAAKAAPRAARASASRPQRGTNAKLVEEVLQSNAPRALRPAEIRTALRRDKGVAIAFTSIRHALGQLESRQIAEQVADSKTWRYSANGGAASASD
jgi:hypothetical protein